jgi:8-oxo-dGTP diphosphatase
LGFVVLRILFLILIVFAQALCESSESYVFIEPPEDFSHQAEVVSCYCEYEGRILYLLRHPLKPQGNTWCVPGGKLNAGETPFQAIVREVNEETGIDLQLESLVYCQKVYVRFPKMDIILHLFKSPLRQTPEKFDLALDEHIAFRWVTKEQALALPLIPGGNDCLPGNAKAPAVEPMWDRFKCSNISFLINMAFPCQPSA